MLDHAGFGVGDYERSKAFDLKALAPLAVTLLMEPMGKAEGFGEHGMPFFWIEDVRRRCEADSISRSPSMSATRSMRSIEAVCHKPV